MVEIEYQEGGLNPFVIFDGFVIQEPITALTDFFAVFVAFYYLIKFFRYKKGELLNEVYHKWILICLGVGFSVAAILGHALQEYLSQLWRVPGWLIVETGITLLALVTIEEYKQRVSTKGMKQLKLGVILFHIIYAIIISIIPHFLITQIHTMLTILGGIFPLYIMISKATKIQEYKNQVNAILYISVCLLFVFGTKFSFSVWLNFKDISHIIIGFLLLLLYKNIWSLTFKDAKLKKD